MNIRLGCQQGPSPQCRTLAGGFAYATEVVDWVREAVQQGDGARLQRTLELAPHAQRAHPTTEHLLPLLVSAAAGGEAAPARVTDGGITHGVLSMDSFVFGTVQ